MIVSNLTGHDIIPTRTIEMPDIDGFLEFVDTPNSYAPFSMGSKELVTTGMPTGRINITKILEREGDREREERGGKRGEKEREREGEKREGER